jgi:hypothetical protein
MPLLKTSASDFTAYVGSVAQARPAGTTAPKANKVAVPAKASTAAKVATVILASKVAVTAASPKTTVIAQANVKVNTTKRG